MDAAEFQRIFDQALHQALINMSGDLANRVTNVVRGTITGNINHQFGHRAQQMLVHQYQPPALLYHQSYASESQEMLYQSPSPSINQTGGSFYFLPSCLSQTSMSQPMEIPMHAIPI